MAESTPPPEGEQPRPDDVPAEESPAGRRETWLVAAWPGMGNVGAGAASYLISKLSATLIHELPGRDVFEIEHIEVKDGLARPGRLPRSMFFRWSNPEADHDLLLFLGESQPPDRGYAFCHRLLDYAISHNITRVITFAAMATQLHPSDDPKVYGVATNGEAIRELQSLEVNLLGEGQISGLNGVLIAAAAERDLPGVCLLGELPYFAAGVPNPKASMAVLEIFAAMSGLEVDFDEIREQSEAVEQALLELLEKMQDAAREESDVDEESLSIPEPRDEPGDEPGEDESTEGKAERPEPKLDYATRDRIERMFEAAREDRSKAVHLKAELDRLGVFEHYEDRFLDLFKKGE